ncbi:gamma-glutamyl-gamma-aminobutyrate hydrolase family protein [Campylobacter novaezeelandiae]|uniref:gamma-glutamyl-CDP-amidate hydrolase n=1 Tax=Campylobacter novaezeelandiae TaxID=2267891 RepID=UPI00103762CE|nr:gamma-glutamyl-CDP-amidate hydrolase [Campylobacter novaezeelandiae]TBR78561.1 gamma-glutamyl-gamma-aminobutyrate hydrolase family protein [Campylobacter novaezeelandiae]
MFIGITQRLTEEKKYKELRETLALEWGNLFSNSILFKDFLPLALSYEIDFNHYAPYLKAVILSGGNDLSAFSDDILSKKRDAYEMKIIEYCLKTDTPLLGICRGAQMIAYYFNSTLEKLSHHIGDHQVILNDGSSFISNSFHNYAIINLGKNLEILARAKDQSIEAFKHKDKSIFGLMWHIERKNGLNNAKILNEWLKLVKEKK